MGLKNAIPRLWARAFGASKFTPARKPPRAADFSPDGAVADASTHLRAWGQHFEQNSDLAVGILDELVDQVVGNGIAVEPMVLNSTGTLNDALNTQLADIWETWGERPEVTNQIEWTELQRMKARAWFREGECFAHHIQGRDRGYAFEAGRLPYAVEFLEAAMVPLDLTDERTGIVQGVEIDAWHRPRAYRVFREAPGNNGIRFSPVAINGATADTLRLPAEQVTHLAFRRRFPEVRGVSVFAPSVARLHDIQDYEESERVAARAFSKISVVITRDIEAAAPAVKPGEERSMVIPTGAIFDDLLPGEKIESITPDRPNQHMNDFRMGQLRAAAAGTGTRYSAIARDYNGTYSSQRQELMEARHHYAPLVTFFIARVVKPAYVRVIETALLTGALTMPAGMTLRQLTRAEYSGPAVPFIDPKKEMESDVLAIDNGLATREQILRRRGLDPRKVPAVEKPTNEQQTTPQERTLRRA